MKIVECPRDAMQGLAEFIPTQAKVKYINQLCRVGFDTIDFGSFVSPKSIPQLRDTAAVLQQLDVSNTPSKLLAIVANTRGAKEASVFDAIQYLGFPLSISETFQQRNTNKSIAEALHTIGEIQEICSQSNQVLVTYISMAFGNPYGDPFAIELVSDFVEGLILQQIKIISLADTIGIANPDEISFLFTQMVARFPSVEWGVHLHASPATAIPKIDAAFNAGCRRFDGALKGFGGCPMANDALVGNLATETLLDYLDVKGVSTGINRHALNEAMILADEIFPKH